MFDSKNLSDEKRTKIGYSQAFLTGVLWGTSGIFVRGMQAGGADSLLISFLRVFFSVFLMAAACLILDGRGGFRASRRVLLYCVLIGAVTDVGFNLFYNEAVALTGMAEAAVLLNTAPVFTAVLSRLVFREKLGARKILAIGLDIAGCVLTASDLSALASGGAGGRFPFFGLFCGLMSGFCYGWLPIFGRLASDDASPNTVNFYSYLAGLCMLGLLPSNWKGLAACGPSVLGYGVLYALIPTAAASLFYMNGMKKIRETSRVPVFTSVEIAVAALIGTIWFEEPMSLWNWVGILMVLGSIAVMSRE